MWGVSIKNWFWGRWTFFDLFWPFWTFFMVFPHFLDLSLWFIMIDLGRPPRGGRDSNLRPLGWEIRVQPHSAIPVTQNSLRCPKYPLVQKIPKNHKIWPNMSQYAPICPNMSQYAPICPPTFRKNRFWGLWTFLYLFWLFVDLKNVRFDKNDFLVRSIN